MDPLSIGSAVVGLISAAARITPLIWHLVNHSIDAPKTASQILAEMDSITSALERLQTFLMGASKISASRRSMLSIRNIVATLTACVTTYSDLEQVVGKCVGKSDGKVNRTKWIMYESEIEELLQRVQAHKSSLTLMLTILQCESMQQAESSMNHLIDLVEGLVASNIDLQNRMDAISIGQAALFNPRSSITIEQDPPSTARSFESDLSVSRIYRKANQRDRIWSISESQRTSVAHSNFSDLTLSNITIIFVLNLPIWSADLSNAAHYTFGQDGLHLTVTELAERYPEIDFNLVEQDIGDDGDDNNAADDIDRWLTPTKHPITTAPAPAPRMESSYLLEDRYDGVFSSAMPIADDNPNPLQAPSPKQPRRDDPTVIYIAASLFEFNIAHNRREAGYPYLVYTKGEIFDVIGMKGELWLARNQNDPDKTVGWIWEKHLAVLAF